VTRCAVCKKAIPEIDLEFGGPHIYLSVDGPIKCHDEWPKKLSRDLAPGGILGSDQAVESYLEGKKP